MTAKRASAVAATGARLIVGAIVAVGSVVAVTAAVAVPWPEASGQAAQTMVTTMPGDLVLSCSGPFRALGRDARHADQLQAAGSPRLTIGGDPERSSIDTPETAGGDGAVVLTAAPDGRDAASASASESWRADAADLSGLAADACGEPSTDSWLVGGSTQTGSSDVLVLSNPGDVAADVTLTVYGAESSTTHVLVPPRTQTAAAFAGIAGGQETPIVRVTASGSPVRAALQSAFVSVLDPAGIDLQSATMQSGQRLTVAGVQVASAQDDGAAVDVLRLLSADADTTASVVIRDATGASAAEFTAPLSAGVPLPVAVPELPVGIYSIEVSAEASLVAGVWQSTGVGGGSDFAWMTPAPSIRTATTFSVPAGPAPKLHVVGLTGRDAAVTLTAADGTDRQVAVPAEGSALVPLRAGTTYRLDTDAAVSAAVTMADAGGLAGWPVTPPTSASRTITVVP